MKPQAVTVQPEPMPPAVVTDSAALMEIITRASKDPAMDPEKMERLMTLYERIEDKRASQAFSDAMSSCQAEMRPVSQNASNPQTKSKYASYAALDQALRPVYTKHGFSVSFTSGNGAAPEYVRVIAKVKHRAGFGEEHFLDLPADGKGAKGGDVMTKTHATMSAVTYGRRGLLKMIFNIAEGAWDDDGNAAGEKISEEQIAELNELGKATNADFKKFLRFMAVDNIASIPAAQFQKAKHALEQRKQGAAK